MESMTRKTGVKESLIPSFVDGNFMLVKTGTWGYNTLACGGKGGYKTREEAVEARRRAVLGSRAAMKAARRDAEVEWE